MEAQELHVKCNKWWISMQTNWFGYLLKKKHLQKLEWDVALLCKDVQLHVSSSHCFLPKMWHCNVRTYLLHKQDISMLSNAYLFFSLIPLIIIEVDTKRSLVWFQPNWQWIYEGTGFIVHLQSSSALCSEANALCMQRSYVKVKEEWFLLQLW